LQKYLGCTVQNAGKSGYSALMWWNNMAQTINYADKDFMLIMLGTNVGLTDTIVADTTISEGQTYLDYANTNTGAYCKIIEHALAQSGKEIQIILVTPPHVGNRRISNKVAAEGARPVIFKISEKYKLPVIDMNKSGFSQYNEDIMQPVDGLHFSILGNKKLGTFIGSQLKSLLSFLIEG
jgi:lysophospholipase L1-like esterase